MLPDYYRRTSNGLPRVVRSIRFGVEEDQAKFGQRFGVWRNTVARWETGRAVPSPLTLITLLQLAKTSEQVQGIRAALDAAGISTDQLQHIFICLPHETSIKQRQGEGNV